MGVGVVFGGRGGVWGRGWCLGAGMGLAGEDLGDVEGLRHEALDLVKVRLSVRARAGARFGIARVRVRVRARARVRFGPGLGFGFGLATLRARATVILSSSESSSIPRMAMMSWLGSG